MRNNPYRGSSAKRFVVAGTDIPASEAPASGDYSQMGYGRGYERRANRHGEINAYSKRDLMRQVSAMINDVASGRIVQAAPSQEEVEFRHEQLRTAFSDPTLGELQVLGETVGDQVWETLGREGFARRLYMTNPVPKGGIGRLRVRQKDVVAIMSTNSINVDETVVRQKYVFPGEFYLLANISIEEREIEQASGDLLDEKFMDGLEQILVEEDKVWKRQADTGSTLFNTLTFFNTLTPAVFASLRSQVGRWGLPVTSCVLAYDLWTDIVSGDEFSNWFDPVSKHEIVLEGRLGSLLDVEIITDAFRHDTLKVLDEGELYFCAAPQTLGGITQRKELTTAAVDKFNMGKPERGWFMRQIQGMALVNPKGVSKGQRA